MQVNFGGLNRAVTEIFLNDTQILRAFIQFACVAVPDFMRRYPFRSVFREDILDGSRRYGLIHLTGEQRTVDSAAGELIYL